MEELLTVTLPVPNKKLHPNGRGTIMEIARLKAKARWDAKMAGLAAKNESRIKTFPWKRAKIAVIFYLLSNKVFDPDGLRSWLKAYQDGLQDAKIIANDKGFSMPGEPAVVVVEKNHRVVLAIERTE